MAAIRCPVMNTHWRSIGKVLLPCFLTLATAVLHAAEPAMNDAAMARTAHIDDPDCIGVGRMLPDLVLTSLDGSEISLAALARTKKAVVLCATSSTCPLSIRYGPKLVAIAQEYANRDVEFVFVNVSNTDANTDMREQANQLGWKGRYLPDAGRIIRASLGIRTTTEVFVVDSNRTMLYRGAVDDQYGVGTARPAARSPWLRQALDAILADRDLEVDASWPPGCAVDPPANVTIPATSVTYNNRISRIMQNRCMTCHRAEGGAPFRLDTFDDVAGRAAMIKALVTDGHMPPWHAAPPAETHLSPWLNDRSLPPNEKYDLLAWLESDKPMGDAADAPRVKRYPAMWAIQRPSLTLTSPTMSIPSDGALRHSAITLDTTLAKDRWLTAIELRPLNHGIFHHALIYLLPNDPTAQEPADITTDLVATLGMGDPLVEFPAGSARRIPAGTRLLVHAYFLSGQKPISERISIGMLFADEPPLAQVQVHAPRLEELVIPAGAADQKISMTTTLDHSTVISALIPTMRARGRSMRYEAHLPDSTTQLLLDVPSYDYRWRERYIFREPRSFPAGTRIQISATFDNSDNNPNNPDPAKDVKLGWGVEQEMPIGYFETIEPVEP